MVSTISGSDVVEGTFNFLQRAVSESRLLNKFRSKRIIKRNTPKYLNHLRSEYNVTDNPFDKSLPNSTFEELLLPLYLLDLHSGALKSRIPKKCDSIEALQKNKKLLLVGEPGSGKTTLVKYIAKNVAECRWNLNKHFKTKSKIRIIPVIIDLRQVSIFIEDQKHIYSDSDNPIREYIGRKLSRNGLFPEIGSSCIKYTIGKGRYIFLFDRFDEISQFNNELFEYLADFCIESKEDWMIVCSRPFAAKNMIDTRKEYKILNINPLQPEEQLNFLKSRIKGEYYKVWRQLHQIPNELRGRPLILSLLAGLYHEGKLRLGWDLINLYEESIVILLGKWTEIRIGDEDKRTKAKVRTPLRIKLFNLISSNIMQQSQRVIDERTLISIKSKIFSTNEFDEYDFHFLIEESPIFTRRERVLEPIHQSFFEYGFASFLLTSNNAAEEIVQNLKKYNDSLVAHFYVQIAPKNKISRLLKKMKKETSKIKDVSEKDIAEIRYCDIVFSAKVLDEKYRVEVINILKRIWQKSKDVRSSRSIAKRASLILGKDRNYVNKICEKLEALKEDVPQQKKLMDLIWAMESQYSIEYLRSWISVKFDNYIRIYAVETLGKLKDHGAIECFSKHWIDEDDWDIKAAMLDAASKIPNEKKAKIFSLANSSLEKKAVVKWEAELAISIEKQSQYINIENLEVSKNFNSLDESLSNIEFVINEWIGQGTFKERIQAMEIFVKYKLDYPKKHIFQMLIKKTLDAKTAWLFARYLRLLADPETENCLKDALNTLDPKKYAFARGELARGIGAIYGISSLDCLCNNYSPSNDEFERLWIIGAIYQMIKEAQKGETKREIVDKIFKKVNEAIHKDNYHRVRHYAELCNEIIPRL